MALLAQDRSDGYSACCWSSTALPARSRSPRTHLLTPPSLCSTSLTQLRSQRPSLRDPTFLWPTVTSQDKIEEMATRPYREVVGALVWLALGTCPDIAFATSLLARLGHNPGRVHWGVVKRVLRYLKGTLKRRLNLGGKSPGIADADWGNNRDDRRSFRAYTVKISDGAVRWTPKKQSCVALSSRKRSTWHFARHFARHQWSPFGWSIS